MKILCFNKLTSCIPLCKYMQVEKRNILICYILAIENYFLNIIFRILIKKKIVDGKNSFNLTHSFFSHPLMKIIQFLRLAASKIAFKTWHLPHIHLYISILDISIYNYKSMYLQMFMHSSGACSVYEC